jgi:hypothetical protein
MSQMKQDFKYAYSTYPCILYITKLLFFFFSFSLISSCSLYKHQYSKGFHIDYHQKNKLRKNETEEKSFTLNTIKTLPNQGLDHSLLDLNHAPEKWVKPGERLTYHIRKSIQHKSYKWFSPDALENAAHMQDSILLKEKKYAEKISKELKMARLGRNITVSAFLLQIALLIITVQLGLLMLWKFIIMGFILIFLFVGVYTLYKLRIAGDFLIESTGNPGLWEEYKRLKKWTHLFFHLMLMGLAFIMLMASLRNI